MHIIAADVGGTKTRLAFADAEKPRNFLYEARYLSGDFDGFESMLQRFIEDSGSDGHQLDTLTLALPGLVGDSSARLTNLPWVIKKQSLKDAFGFKNVYFMNDFQASAFGTAQLLEKDRIILNPGVANPPSANSAATKLTDQPDGLTKNTTRVAVGAGTGLGVAWADETESSDATSCTHDTEGGHIDFAPTDDIQIKLLQFLQQSYGHVSYERILSGSGLVSLYQFCAGEPCSDNQAASITAEWVSKQAKTNEAADRALSLFVQIYGAYVGNIALLFKPYGGIFITGGIAAKIINKMQSEEFINAYLHKGRMRTLVEQVAVYLVTNERVGVLGAMSQAIKMHKSIQQVSK